MSTLAKAAAGLGVVAAATAVGAALILPAGHQTAGSGQQAAVSQAAGGNGGVAAAGTTGGARGASGGSAASTGTGSTSTGSTSTGNTGAGTAPGHVVTTGGGTGSSTGTGTGSGGTGIGSGSTGGAGTGTITSTGGQTSTGTTATGLHIPHTVISALPHLLGQTVTAIPSPSGTIGDPGVPCLQGYVWRQAYSGDYVCVTPATRSQAAADNAAAVSRVQQGGGAYGQYTCQQGYVWRQVVPDDYTCVTGDTRSEAVYDNSQVNNRVALFSLWVTDWDPSSDSTSCSGDVCTTTEGEWDGPDFQVNGEHFNYGQVQLQIRSDNGTLLWWANVTAGSYPGYPGGAFGAHTPIGDCSSDPGTTDNEYVVAYDLTSGQWSNKLPIDSDCASF
ncbi:MAG TPA: hypothetical protein VGG25_08825 [Streptosporangiaceae bacterium]|jgi:hypothetical protein